MTKLFDAEDIRLQTQILAKKISDIQAGLVKPDELSGIEQLLLADPRLTSSIVSGYSTGPSS